MSGDHNQHQKPNSTTDVVEPEPVAWMSYTETNGKMLHLTKADAYRWSSDITPLYTAPPKRIWQSIRSDEVDRINDYVPVEPKQTRMLRLVRAIEAKLREKNA